jgi:hypothetical protein
LLVSPPQAKVAAALTAAASSRARKSAGLSARTRRSTLHTGGILDEDFCLPKHNKPNCEHCKMVCTDCDAPCDPKAPYVGPKRFVWTDWIPGCATMHCRRKLYKKVETQKVPSFKWVVEDLCPHCESNCDVAEVSPEDKVPAPPQMADAKLLYRLK